MYVAISRSEGARGFQRNEGVVNLSFARRGVDSAAMRVYQQGSMKVRFPNVARGTPPEAVLVNISGGVTGGDAMRMTVSVDEGASAIVTSQACEKIYRSMGGDAHIEARLSVAEGGTLEWLPQPSILFDRARMDRVTEVDLAPGASLLAVEGIIFGRTAMNEEMREGKVNDALFIRRGGRLIHGDRFACEGDMAAELARPTALNGARAMATIRYVAGDASARLEGMRASLEGLACAAASAWNGMMVVRLVASDGYELTRALTKVLEAFRARPLPRAWYI